MFEVIGLVVGGAAAVAGYIKSRSFVKRRLRYVDSIQKSSVPILAGAAAAIVAAPVVALLPLIGGPAAIAFGLAVGAGTHAGAKDIRDGKE
jgi:hypothetical protein